MRVAEKEEDVLSDCTERGETETETRNHAKYKADVCEFVGLVQALLLSNRPSVAIGAVVLVAMSVQTSVFLVSLHLMEMAKLATHLG